MSFRSKPCSEKKFNRSISLGVKLIRETLPRVGTPCVELIAVMAKYNLFAEKAGMKKVLEQKPSEEVL